MRWVRALAVWLGMVLSLMVAGCAHPIGKATGGASWGGRLALQVESDQTQSFSAGFELTGDALSGELALFNPLGGTLAVLAWTPGSATLRANDQVSNFDSLDVLVARATGTAIPVAALFDWLAGRPTEVPGWQPDLSRLSDGRLAARRLAPSPTADLRVVLDQ